MKSVVKKALGAWLALMLVAAAVIGVRANAALRVGETAPDFTAQATLGGKQFTFTLSEALKHGPVVLYFYPKAFTKGCTEEAHDFAEATERYRAYGATVIGVSGDSMDVLDKFSVSECQSKFAVIADPDRKIMIAYDSVLVPTTSIANRTSYVITPDDRIIYYYTALDPDKHVEYTLNAIGNWRAAHPAAAK
jgi:peroxiredoxin